MTSREYLEQYLKINNLKKDVEKESEYIEKLDYLQKEINLNILKLEDKEQSRILFLKYVKGLSIQQIAMNMFISRETAFRLHRKSLKNIKVDTQ